MGTRTSLLATVARPVASRRSPSLLSSDLEDEASSGRRFPRRRATSRHPAISLSTSPSTSILRAPDDSAAQRQHSARSLCARPPPSPSRGRHDVFWAQGLHPARSLSARRFLEPGRCESVFFESGSLLKPVASPSASFSSPISSSAISVVSGFPRTKAAASHQISLPTAIPQARSLRPCLVPKKEREKNFLENTDCKRAPKPITRYGCPARLEVRREAENKWVVSKFIEKHCHDLMTTWTRCQTLKSELTFAFAMERITRLTEELKEMAKEETVVAGHNATPIEQNPTQKESGQSEFGRKSYDQNSTSCPEKGSFVIRNADGGLRSPDG
ncbi:hypothetical protein ACLOJK_020574 [Asimina triloba]